PVRHRPPAPGRPGLDTARGGQAADARRRLAEPVPERARPALPRDRAPAGDADRGPGGRRSGGGAMSPGHLDLEARAHSEHAQELRLWLRLLACSQFIEKRVRTGLREQFGTTLPRFDLMAQLERHPEGLKMKELSHRLMVTGGNVTGITDQLVAEGLVERTGVEGDRRVFRVRLTARGRTLFTAMARQHADWIEP